jgi:hypothetical protein
MIGVSIAASTCGPSSPQPAFVITESAVVTAVTVVAESTTVSAIGTTSLRALTRGLRTRRAYHCACKLAYQTANASRVATIDPALLGHAASMSSAV